VTYCVAVRSDAGLVFLSDSRTNAGVDQINTFRKMVNLIFGGQIKGEAPRLFNIYSAGNFIEATHETPYFQIGESKYGKPILDRVVGSQLSLDEVAKCCLISMDSTMKSNLSVGLPLDLLCYERDSLHVHRHTLIDAKDPYYASLRDRWGEQLRKVFNELPDPGYWQK